MTDTIPAVEWIVREVVRRLRDGGTHPSACSGNPLPAPEVPDNGLLQIGDRVVTWQQIGPALTPQVSRVEVAGDAIVTPSVTDELRLRRITLVRAAKPMTAQPFSFIVGCDAAEYAPWLEDDAWRACNPRRLTSASRRELVAQIVRYLDHEERRAVVISAASGVLACALNRYPNIRAAAVVREESWQDDVEAFAANCLVVDPRFVSRERAGAIATQFRKMDIAQCPLDWQPLLMTKSRE